VPTRSRSQNLDDAVGRAVAHFWRTREGKGEYLSGREAVVGGAQMDGFAELVATLLRESGLPDASVYQKKRDLCLPGFYRPTKNWDLIVVVDGRLLASLEFKSHVGSFGNNYNNRTEEALGNATDLWRAFQEGAFKSSPRPWLGWLMLLEDSEKSSRPVRPAEPFFPVLPEFKSASYAMRYEQLCRKLIRERLYDGACLILSSRDGGKRGEYREPSQDIGMKAFAASLMSHAAAYSALR